MTKRQLAEIVCAGLVEERDWLAREVADILVKCLREQLIPVPLNSQCNTGLIAEYAKVQALVACWELDDYKWH